MAADRYYLGPGLLGKIRRTIRRVDMLPGGESGPTFDPVYQTLIPPRGGGSGSGGIKICTFTGSWVKSTSKTVTFKYQTATPNTVSATNLFADISVDCGIRNCAVARDGTAWFVISAEC